MGELGGRADITMPRRELPSGPRSNATRALVLTGIVTVAATFAPWVRSGSRDRSSYAVASTLDQLDVLHGWTRPAVTVLWYFVPLIAALAALAVAAGRRGLATTGFAVLSVLVLAFSRAAAASSF